MRYNNIDPEKIEYDEIGQDKIGLNYIEVKRKQCRMRQKHKLC